MVHARLPERVFALHPGQADEDILQAMVERMPHMQRPGHIGRRHHNGVGLFSGLRIGSKATRRFPARHPASLSFGGIKRLGQHKTSNPCKT